VVSFPSVVLLVGFATYKDGQLARREQPPFAAYLISDLSKNWELQEKKGAEANVGRNVAIGVEGLVFMFGIIKSLRAAMYVGVVGDDPAFICVTGKHVTFQVKEIVNFLPSPFSLGLTTSLLIVSNGFF
jgi:hypothetical protein